MIKIKGKIPGPLTLIRGEKSERSIKLAGGITARYTKNIKKELNISNKILLDLIKHIFAVKIDDEIIPIQLSDIQQKLYDALEISASPVGTQKTIN